MAALETEGARSLITVRRKATTNEIRLPSIPTRNKLVLCLKIFGSKPISSPESSI